MHKPRKPTAMSTAGAFAAIDAGKLQPPRSTSQLVPRERLHSALLEARQRRCFVLRGPAGCGKTSVLIGWRQQLLPLGYDFAWLTLTDDDNELSRFLDYLLASVAQIAPEMVREAVQFNGRGTDREAVERTLISLVRGVAEQRRELVLVLDDLHNLTDLGIHEALQWLIDYAPTNLHLVLVSRSSLPVSLGRLRSQALTLELELDDLRFSAEESERFLRSQLGALEPGEARQLHERTDGWIAGLQLLCVGRRKAPHGAAEPTQLRDTEAFEAFFNSEVLAQLAPEEFRQLLHMAVCSRFCAALCAALDADPQAVVSVAALLARLERDNLFLIAVEGSEQEPWYRLHPLLRETLLKHFARLDDAQRRAVHRRAWLWFRDHEQLDEAVRHAVLAGESAAAAELVEARTEALYAQGELRQMGNLVRLLPIEEVEARNMLSILLARLHIYAQHFAAAEELLEQLLVRVPPSDTVQRFRLTLLRATLAVQRDDTDGAMQVLPDMLQPPAEADVVLIGGSLNIRSWLHMHRGEYEQARRLQLDRPPLRVNGVPLLGSASGSLQGRCLIGLSLALEGQMTQAERVYREVLYEAERGGKACAEAHHLAAALLGEVLYENNEVDAAYQLLSAQLDILERVAIPDSVLRVLGILAASQWLAGNRQEAFAYLERLEDYANKLDLDRLRAYSLVWRVHWHLLLGEQVAAEDKLAQLDVLAARNPLHAHSALKEIQYLRQYSQVRMLAAQGDLQGAVHRLQQVAALCEEHGRQGMVVRMHILAAVLETRLGHTVAAHRKVLDALRRGHRFGLLRSLLDAHSDALQLISEVAASTPLDPVLAFYVERLQRTQSQALQASRTAPPTPAKRATPSGLEPLKEREIEIMRLLAQALPNKKIARALGLSPETVKWHLSHIYTKLGVNSRDEAVARMRDLEAGEADG
ncbi:AAA family ATPase [Pseudomonas sp. UL073]|uniref:AAA family ATPase n=1 Tax=Zestomonas insulae TaxID=2809017 RepID=A0ABS2IIX7_9GAMM|nr:LuxR C-terminal-related transcriptional regulator [Pseudomonas insulae]MBM7063026.1 AAA family ATPase [Pseudomonas insulae]